MPDVIVIGGGTSGFAAALAAARAGARVRLLEQTTCLGGTMTGGLVPGMVSMRHQPWRDEETLVQMETLYSGEQVVRGIAQELVDRLVACGGAYGRMGAAPVRVMFDQELTKWVIESMVREAGVEISYQAKVVNVEREGARVTGVRFNYNERLDADVVIDATGDGHVAWLAGAEYEQGEGNDTAYVQPMSLYFLMGGVDLGRTVEYIVANPTEYTSGYVETLQALYRDGKPFTIIGLNNFREEADANGDYPRPYGATTVNPRAHSSILRPVYRSGRMRYDVTMHNVDMAYRVDATDSRQLSEAVGSMRDFTVRMAGFFHKYVPGFEDAYLLQIADQVGVRETRRIIGDYVLTGEDVLAAARFDDCIGYCGATIDVHSIAGHEKMQLSPIREGRSYQIPYRILLPRGLDGLLVAGRCVSTDRASCGSIRHQVGCMVTGQAAGAAAALSARAQISPRELSVEQLQQELRAQDVVL